MSKTQVYQSQWNSSLRSESALLTPYRCADEEEKRETFTWTSGT